MEYWSNGYSGIRTPDPPDPITPLLHHTITPLLHSACTMTCLVDELTLPQIRAFAPQVVVIPVGSTEAHALHLPWSVVLWSL